MERRQTKRSMGDGQKRTEKRKTRDKVGEETEGILLG